MNAAASPEVTDQVDRALTLVFADRVQILGASSGSQIAMAGGTNVDVDPRWTAGELQRVQRGGARCFWLFATHVLRVEADAMTTAVDRAALVEAFQMVGHLSWVQKYCEASVVEGED